MSTLELLRVRGLVTVQDGGRPRLAHLGVPPSGALDQHALARANRAVGNRPTAAALETTLGGVWLRARGDCTVAVAGAIAPLQAAGEPAAPHLPLRLRDGDELRVGAASAGARTYVAVAGGLAVAPVLGSAATDLLTGLGPAPLRAGDVLGIARAAAATAPRPGASAPQLTRNPTLPVALGPREDWFTPDALRTLAQAEYVVSPASNRVGLRLEGPALARAHDRELASEGVVEGALQVPPSGQPIVLLRDHPTTGGYPVVAVVLRAALWRLGQLRPGERVRFDVVSP